MRFFVEKFKWVMLVCGLLTCTMFLGFVSPRVSLESNFGETLSGPLAEMIVRNWSALIGMVGIMLIYGAFRPAVRNFALVIAGISKLIFVGLVLACGRQYLGHGVGIAVVADVIMVTLFAAYLILDRESNTG